MTPPSYHSQHYETMDFNSPRFRTVLCLASLGNHVAVHQLILATMPIVKNLTDDDDEASALVLHLYERVIPRWRQPYPWGSHAKKLLTWHLLRIRANARRRTMEPLPDDPSAD